MNASGLSKQLRSARQYTLQPYYLWYVLEELLRVNQLSPVGATSSHVALPRDSKGSFSAFIALWKVLRREKHISQLSTMRDTTPDSIITRIGKMR
jgi:hypothetical protein